MNTVDSSSPSWNLIDPTRLARISHLALPIIAGALATNLMTFIDTLMVGRLGDAALGGVGVSGQLFFLFLTLVLGLGAGVQAMVARHIGENRPELTGKALNAGILMAAMAGTASMVLGYLLAPSLFSLMSNDLQVIEQGLAYLSTRWPSVLIIGVNVVFRSYWVGVSMATWSMISIVALSVSNVLFNYMLIFGHLGAPTLGVTGAGLGSTLATLVGLIVNVVLALRLARKNSFLNGLPESKHVSAVIRISYPESARQALFTTGVMLMYVLVGHIGTSELAAFHVIISICLIAYMPHIGLGGAATTLVGEALGAKRADEARTWGWQVSNLTLLLLTLVSSGIAYFADRILPLLLVDKLTCALAIVPLQILVFAHVWDGYAKVLGSALIGAGAAKTTLYLTVLPQWFVLLPLLAVVTAAGYGLSAATAVIWVATALSAIAFAWAWHQLDWSKIPS